MCVTTFASVEQFSTGTRMFLERRDPAVSYVTAAIPELWKSSGTVELRARLIVEVVVQLAAIGLYLIAWLPRVAATVVPPMTHARIRLTLGVLLALAVQLVVLERITNQIQWNMVAAVVGLK